LSGIVGEGGRLVIIGTLLGLTASIGLGRVIAPLLFQVRAIDPLTLGSMVVLVLVVTLTASYVPARRATRIDPMVALRCE